MCVRRENKRYRTQTLKKVFSKHRPSASVCLSVRLCVCVSVCLFTFEVPFNGLFSPISRSRMSNIFRDSESLGKSNGKKWSQIWTFLFENCLKSPRKKKISSLFSVFFGFQSFLTVFLPPLPEVGCPIFLEIRKEVVSDMKIFVWKLSKIAAQKKVFFLHFFWSSSVFGLFWRSLCPHFPNSDVQYF